MKTTIDFDKSTITNSSLDIPSVGHCAIEASNTDGYHYYLVIYTVCGTSYISQCGPVVPDIYHLPDGYACSFTTMEYNEKKLYKTISIFLNDFHHAITQARLVSLKEASQQIRDLSGYLLEQLDGDDIMDEMDGGEQDE